MKIREVIEMLLKDNDLDSEIIFDYYDKKYFLDSFVGGEIDTNKMDKVWVEFVEEGQQTLAAHLEFTQTGYDLISDLEELIEGESNG
jgi:hypothetical protein